MRTRWPLRATDEDVLGHVNNAAYWHAVEQVLRRGSDLDPARPFRARLDHHHPLDLEDDVELVESSIDGRVHLAFVVGGVSKAIAVVESI
jgi:acyl-ACP thioesterase